MSEKELSHLLSQLHHTLQTKDYTKSQSLLTAAKLALLQLNALLPTPSLAPSLVQLAREVLELGALLSIRMHDAPAFTRYFFQLQPFYEVGGGAPSAAQSKVTGLYLLLLLSQGDYAAFHTQLESLQMGAAAAAGGARVEDDVFVGYPVKLERWLMEGSYDKVWAATKSAGVPADEYAVFSEVLNATIRNEIASCSEKAYASLPISNAKNLLFLESEGAVVEFARGRGWLVRDGRISFPRGQGEVRSEKEILDTSGTVIEHTIGYARELETIQILPPPLVESAKSDYTKRISKETDTSKIRNSSLPQEILGNIFISSMDPALALASRHLRTTLPTPRSQKPLAASMLTPASPSVHCDILRRRFLTFPLHDAIT
ncbi:MAG: regulatory particle non-ATPase [Trizodia sp. TS-e1964]|nr:MAG: regulatory particle non-ATPase [Trizodia sp. TS-e1964]